MANYELKFIDVAFNHITIQCGLVDENGILIRLTQGDSFKQILLDKSTAIKFAKTLRTEINKITESEVNNG